MIALFCRHNHAPDQDLCADCGELARYAAQRIDKCPFGEEKPTCANCSIHCYKPRARERVRAVMRYAGPRMLLRHPLLAIAHKLDGRREAPAEPRRAGAESRNVAAVTRK